MVVTNSKTDDYIKSDTERDKMLLHKHLLLSHLVVSAALSLLSSFLLSFFSSSPSSGPSEQT